MTFRQSTLLLVSATALAVTGCSNVTTSVAGQNTVKGEAWYVKATGFAGLTFSTQVFYCRPPTGRGSASCMEAKMHEEPKAPEASDEPSGEGEGEGDGDAADDGG